MRATSRVVGMVAGGREHIVARVQHGDPVLLLPEPDNPYDRHAVAVYTTPRQLLAEPVVSSVKSPPAGTISAQDRRTMLDRQAGYLPRDVAARLDLPRTGAVGWVSQVRYAPAETRFDHHGNTVPTDDPRPAGFDVTAWLEYRHDDGDHLDDALDLNGSTS